MADNNIEQKTVWIFGAKFPEIFTAEPSKTENLLQPKSLLEESLEYIKDNPQVLWPKILFDAKVFLS